MSSSSPSSNKRKKGSDDKPVSTPAQCIKLIHKKVIKEYHRYRSIIEELINESRTKYPGCREMSENTFQKYKRFLMYINLQTIFESEEGERYKMLMKQKAEFIRLEAEAQTEPQPQPQPEERPEMNVGEQDAVHALLNLSDKGFRGGKKTRRTRKNKTKKRKNKRNRKSKKK